MEEIEFVETVEFEFPNFTLDYREDNWSIEYETLDGLETQLFNESMFVDQVYEFTVDEETYRLEQNLFEQCKNTI